MKRIRILAALGLAALPLAGCTPVGACVITSDINPGSWDHCFDGWEQNECVNYGVGAGQTWHGGQSCSSIGFTQHCPADGAGVYRLPSYGC